MSWCTASAADGSGGVRQAGGAERGVDPVPGPRRPRSGRRGRPRALPAHPRPPARRGHRRPATSALRHWWSVSTASHELGVRPLPVAAVVVAQQRQADRHRVDVAVAELGDEDQVAARLRHLLAVVGRPCRRGRSSRERARRAATWASRRRTSRGAGRPGRSHRPGRRRRSRGAPSRSRCTRCATRTAPAERALPGRLARALAAPHEQSSGSFLPGRSGSPPRSAKSGSMVSRSSPETEPKAGSAVTEK